MIQYSSGSGYLPDFTKSNRKLFRVGFHVFDHLCPGICSTDSVCCEFHILLECFQGCICIISEITIYLHSEHGLQHRYCYSFAALLDNWKLGFNLIS